MFNTFKKFEHPSLIELDTSYVATLVVLVNQFKIFEAPRFTQDAPKKMDEK